MFALRFFQTPPRGDSPCVFTSPSPPSGWAGDLHPQAAEHAQHTTKPLARRTLRVGKGSGRRLRLAPSWRLCVLARDYRRAGMTENAIAKEIVDAAFRIHTTLGPGLLESVYETVLGYELDRRGLRIVRQQPIPVVYDSIRIDTGFRADLIVEDKVIVEVKSVELLAAVHKKQLLTYLRLADKRLGLLINFHVALIKAGISRVVNGLEDDSHAKSPSRQDTPL